MRRITPFFLLGALALTGCHADKNHDQDNQDADHDATTDDDVGPLDECSPGRYGADCGGVCACTGGAVCVEGRTGDGACLTRLHDALGHLESPFAFTKLRVDAASGRMLGIGVVTAREQYQLFAMKDGDIDASPLVGEVTWLTTAPLAIVVSNGALWRIALADLSATRLSGDEQVTAAWLSPDETKVFYLVQTAGALTTDLFIVGLDGTGRVSLTHGAITDEIVSETFSFYGKYIVAPRMVADGSRVVFVVATETKWDLYSVTTAGTGLLKLNGTGTVGYGDSSSFAFSTAPTGSRVVYVADDDTPDAPELYAVDADGGNRVTLNGPLEVGGAVNEGYRQFTADITAEGHVLFMADSDADASPELYTVGLDGGGRVMLSDAAEYADPSIWPQVSPDETTVIYFSDVLRAVPLSGGTSVPLSAPGNFFSYYEVGPQFTADGGSVVYAAAEDPSDLPAVHVVHLDGSNRVKLSGQRTDDVELYSGGVGTATFYLTPSGHVVYRANAADGQDHALFVVGLDGSNVRRMSPAKTQNFYVSSEYLGEYGGKIYFTADPTVWTRYELFTFDVASGDVANVSQSMPQFVSEDAMSAYIVHDSGDLWAIVTSYSFSVFGKEVIVMDVGARTSCRVDLPVTATSMIVTLAQPTAGGAGGIYMRGLDHGEFPIYRAGADCHGSTIVDPAIQVGNIGQFQISPDAQKLIFVDGSPTGASGLYIMGLNGEDRVRLSGDFVSGGGIVGSNSGGFVVAPDMSRVVYVADQDTADRFELYAVDLDGNNRMKISPSVTTGSGVGTNGGLCAALPITPDSQRVVFTARVTASSPTELYSVKLDGTDAHKLTPAMTGSGVPDGSCDTLRLTPDGAHVVYNAAQDGVNDYQNYIVALDGTTNMKLSAQLYGDERANAGKITPDGQYLVYPSSSPGTDVVRLISSRIDGGGSVHVEGTEAGYLSKFDFSGSRIVFQVYDSVGSTLHAADFDGGNGVVLSDLPAGSQVSTRLNPAYVLASDGRVLFVVEKREDDGSFTSSVMAMSNQGGPATTIMAGVKGRFVESVKVTAAGDTIIVVGDLARPGVTEVFAYPF